MLIIKRKRRLRHLLLSKFALIYFCYPRVHHSMPPRATLLLITTWPKIFCDHDKDASDVISSLLKLIRICGLSVEYFSTISCINISPKWCHKSTIISQRKWNQYVLWNLHQKRNYAIGVDQFGQCQLLRNSPIIRITIRWKSENWRRY